MIKAVLFDCFGVLVGKGFEHTYRLAGGDPRKDRVFIEDLLGQANFGMISNAEFHRSIKDRLKITDSQWRAVVREAEQPDREILDYVASLRPGYKTAILSNANTGVLSRKIGDALLVKCFDEVIVSAEIGIVKPDPRIYEYAANLLDVEPKECVFIDDRAEFVIAAKNCGMEAIVFRDFEQLMSDLAPLLPDTKD